MNEEQNWGYGESDSPVFSGEVNNQPSVVDEPSTYTNADTEAIYGSSRIAESINNQANTMNSETNFTSSQDARDFGQTRENVFNQSEEPKFAEVQIEQKKPEEIRNDSYFDGGLLELFAWNLLRWFLTGISLTFAKPWGDCMYYRYVINHTVLNGKRLHFVGTGGELFVERFKWLFFTIITLLIYGLWVPIKHKKWIISKIHFKDEEYVEGESFFDGTLLQSIGINILSNLLTVLTLGIMYPFVQCLKLRWLTKHTIINRKKIIFKGKALNLWGHYLLWFILTLITFGIYSLWLGIRMKKWEVKNTSIKLASEDTVDKESFVPFLVAISVAVTVVFIIILALVSFVSSHQFYKITSNSMSPTFNSGDTIYVTSIERSDEVEVGDIITFVSSSLLSPGMTITHRVVQISTNSDGVVCYITKGDNNMINDQECVSYYDVIGKYKGKLWNISSFFGGFPGKKVVEYNDPW